MPPTHRRRKSFTSTSAFAALATIFGSSTIELGAASSEAVKFAILSSGTLKLDDPAEFTGLISGYHHGDTTISVSLSGSPPQFTSAVTISDGVHTVHLALSGIFTVGLHLASDGLGGSLVGYL